MSIAPLSALNASLQGMRNCLRQMNDAATTIVRASEGPAATAPGADGTAPGAADAGTDTDLAGGMITVRFAQRMFAANAATLRAADQMAQDAIDLIGPSRR